MAGQWTVIKPSRSDEVLESDQQLRIANEIRAQFDSIAPKRPIKPNRSEPDTTTTTSPSLDVPAVNGDIPELHKFQSLQSRSHAILSAEGATVVQDEFVETQYYKELISIDKQHHTTGSGFINVVKEGGEDGYDLQVQRGHGDREMVFTGFRSNPATNDWIPSVDEDQVVFVSTKPNRSESC